jgi:hypothetical protein
MLCGAVLMVMALAAPTITRAQSSDEDQIRQVITSAYIDGLHMNGSRDDIRAGFHPDFVMKVLGDNGVTDVTIEEWIARLPAEGNAPGYEVTARFPQVIVTGTAAVAQVEVMYDGDQVFTDYMSLYRFPEGWRIVAKIFDRVQ